MMLFSEKKKDNGREMSYLDGLLNRCFGKTKEYLVHDREQTLLKLILGPIRLKV